jgi:hypothetical protein
VQATPTPDLAADPACSAQEVCTSVGGSVTFEGAVTGGGTPPFTFQWQFDGGNPFESADNPAETFYNAVGTYTASMDVTDDRGKHCSSGSDVTRSVHVIGSPPGGGEVSINSTSANGAPEVQQVAEQPFDSLPGFTVIGINDLGMHCADLDSRVLAILPPFNVLHTTVLRKGVGETPETLPRILTNADVEVVFSATSNPLDPVLDGDPSRVVSTVGGDVYKTNFWDLNPRGTGNILGFDLYDAFYPDTVLDGYNSTASVDTGLPVPDLFLWYLGPDGVPDTGDEVSLEGVPGLASIASMASMPGIADPYLANDPQHFDRFDTTVPFFIDFPFGYTLTDMSWFAVDGVPISYVDDQGRENPYPLMRVQAKAAAGNNLGVSQGTVLASVDTVVPISIESDCKDCHTSSLDGGNGQAACFPTFDAGCSVEGGLRSGAAFTVVSPSDDTADTTLPASEEWAADTNIVRLHDAKHGPAYPFGDGCDNSSPAASAADPDCLQNRVPVACQSCHYTPALDLAHVGPSDDNGKSQTGNKSFSNVMHSFHAVQFPALFPTMPAPVLDGNGNVTNQATRLAVRDQTCYKCHPGKRTECLRGAMYQGDMLCQDCHGNMADVGEDFTRSKPEGSFEVSGDFYTNSATARVPWANEPMCQSCHTGDAVDNLAADTDTIAAGDSIRLLRAYRTDANGDPKDLNARPIVASNRRFAENAVSDANGDKQVLYRLSKGHGGVFCEACHGPTHAIWPVTPRSGPFVANDNATATQLQGHDGKIQECDVCHERDELSALTMPLGLNGPHGMHAVNDERWNLDHRSFTGSQFANCRVCHGPDLKGTVLSETSADRVVICKNDRGDFDCSTGVAAVPAGTKIGCGNCHRQK